MTFLQIGVGAVVYGMILLVLRDPFIWKQVERIIKNRSMFKMETAEFYKEEIRCGWRVDEKTKRIWAVQLEMLDEVERICKNTV